MAVECRKVYVGSKDSVIIYSGTPSAFYAFNKHVLGAVAKYF